MSSLITWMAFVIMSTDGSMVIEASAVSDAQNLRQGLARIAHVELESCHADVDNEILEIDAEYDPVEGITIADVPAGDWCAVNFVFDSEPSFTTESDEQIKTIRKSVWTEETGANPFGIIVNKGVMSGNPG